VRTRRFPRIGPLLERSFGIGLHMSLAATADDLPRPIPNLPLGNSFQETDELRLAATGIDGNGLITGTAVHEPSGKDARIEVKLTARESDPESTRLGKLV
jgi:hypothetical protein